jgi:hypothetical protein
VPTKTEEEGAVLGDLLGGDDPMSEEPGAAPEVDMRLESAQGVLDAIKSGDAQALLDALDALHPYGSEMGEMPMMEEM